MARLATLVTAVLLVVGCSTDATPGPASNPSVVAQSTPTPTTAAPTPTATEEVLSTPTATPTVAATLAPTREPTPEPTEVPELTITKVSLTATVKRGGTASVTVKTAAKAYCEIDVVYKSGSSTAAGLGPKTADTAGKVSWSWKVGTRTTPGTWPIYITCETDDQYGELTLSFRVV